MKIPVFHYLLLIYHHLVNLQANAIPTPSANCSIMPTSMTFSGDLTLYFSATQYEYYYGSHSALDWEPLDTNCKDDITYTASYTSTF